MPLFARKKEAAASKITGDGEKLIARNASNAPVKVLGGGCAKCHALLSSVREALGELGMDDEAALVTDYTKIAAYGVMSTPALVIGEKVVSSGRVLSVIEAREIIKKSRGQA